MAKISRIFRLNKSQYELDFVDVDVNRDKPLFLDPFFLSIKTDAFSMSASSKIKSFFQHNVELIRSGNEDHARKNFVHLNEPNETCFGVSRGRPKGRGMGNDNSTELFESISNSEAVKTGTLEDLEDTSIFIDGIGRDKVSDMTTNLIRYQLIKYTQEQCKLHDIPLTPQTPSGFFWDAVNRRWDSELTDMLVINGRKILLVPKGVASFAQEYTPSKYHRQFALTFLQADHIRRKTTLVRKSYTPKGVLAREWVTKKDLIEEELPPSKNELYEFTRRHPEVFSKFRDETAKKEKSLNNSDIGTNVTLHEVAEYLISELQHILPGTPGAQSYHKLMLGVLELIFYPNLINPIKEREINEGRKRVDITFDNGATSGGFFHRLQHVMAIPCQYIFVECKNYTGDIENPEIDQMIGRFSVNRGKFGIIVCRNTNDMRRLIQRCRDAYQAQQGLIIPMTDQDIISILSLKARGGEEVHPEEQLLSDRARDIML